MPLQKRTPAFIGSTDTVLRKIIKKYLQLTYPGLTNAQIAGAIRAKGPAMEDVLSYIKRKYYGLKTRKEIPPAVAPAPAESIYFAGTFLSTGKPDDTYIKIQIEDFKDFDEDLVYQFLLIQENNNFEIIVPRDWERNKELNAAQYLGAAYIGDILSAEAKSFSYFVPSPKGVDSFHFFLYQADILNLTRILTFIIRAYYKTDDGTAAKEFHLLADDHMENCRSGRLDSMSQGLMAVAMKIYYP